MDGFLNVWFCNFIRSHLENTGSLNYAKFPNVVTFHSTTSKKSCSLSPLPILSEKANQKSIEKLLSSWQTHIFQNPNFPFKAPISSLGTNTVSWFFSKQQPYFIYFRENICQIRKPESAQLVWQSSRVKMMSHEKQQLVRRQLNLSAPFLTTTLTLT